MATKYHINPETNITQNTFKNIMVNITTNISYLFGPNVYVVNQSVYLNLIKKIIYQVTKYLKIYKFANFGITNINVEIYNKDINLVLYVYFKITEFYYYVNSSDWYSFYNGIFNSNPTVVYNNMNLVEQNELRYGIASGKFYINDNVNFTIDTKSSTGILLKNEYDSDDNSCSCNSSYITNSNDSGNLNTNSSNVYITTLYWY